MQAQNLTKSAKWQKTQYANLVRYVPSGVYFARGKVAGKLIRESLNTTVLTVAQARLDDVLRRERQLADRRQALTNGKLNFRDALNTYRTRLQADPALKPRSKEYREERISALLKTWPTLETIDVRKINRTDCLDWASRFGEKSSAIAYNNTVGTLRQILKIAVEVGARYDNPADVIKKQPVRPKRLTLPDQAQFFAMIAEIEAVRFGMARHCADLVRFLAFSGMRKGEAACVTWADCDFGKKHILVRGDTETGTKNWSVRRVPMIPEMRCLLERLRAERPDDQPSTPVMKVRECQGAITSATKKLEIPRITHHDLRHLFATRCIEMNIDIPTVAHWLGHKDGGALAMKTYGHLRDAHSKAMAEKVTFAIVTQAA